MKIRRYEIDYIFNTIYGSNLHMGSVGGNARFICIPRYNVCINLRSSSIDFFFNYVYKVRTFKTYLIWFLIRMAAIIPSLHVILNRLGLQHKIIKTSQVNLMDWSLVDLIYVEWHFFGIFSKSKQTVTHLLAKEAYEKRFENELKARQLGGQFKNLSKVFPKLLEVSEKPKYYVEELAVDIGNQLIEKPHLNLAQKKIKKLNRKTLDQVPLDDYYKELLQKLGEIKNKKLVDALNDLKEAIETEYLDKGMFLEMALVHGDFNAGQVLTKDGEIRIIDWGDGGFLNRFFDYISISIYKSPDNSFNDDYFPKKLAIIKKFMFKKLNSNPNTRLYVLITLLEILLISKGEFEENQGAYPRWINAVANNV